MRLLAFYLAIAANISLLALPACSTSSFRADAPTSDRSIPDDIDGLNRMNASLGGSLDFRGLLFSDAQWINPEAVVLSFLDEDGQVWRSYDLTSDQFSEYVHERDIVQALRSAADNTTLHAGSISGIRWTALTKAEFDFGALHYRCDVATLDCEPLGPALQSARQWPPGADIFGDMGPAEISSPNGKMIARRNGANVEIFDLDSQKINVKTQDGEGDYAYGNTLPTSWSGRVQVPLAGLKPPVEGLWSPDSRFFLTFVTDSRHTRELSLLQSQPGNDRSNYPRGLSYKAPAATDTQLVQLRYVLIDTETQTVEPIEMPWLNAPIDPIRTRFVQWKDGSSSEIFFLSHSRGSRDITLWETNTVSKRAIASFHETAAWRAGVTGSEVQYDVEDIPGTNSYVWYSDRDGRGRFYFLDETGHLKHAISPSDVTAKDIKFIDTAENRLVFTGFPDVEKTDPDRIQLYSAPLSGGKTKRRTSLEAKHDIWVSPDGSSFLGLASRIDMPPQLSLTELSSRNAEAKTLFKTNADGWELSEASRPQRFEVFADDGATKLYGNLYRPSYWVPTDTYPIINWIYGSAEYAVAQEGFSEIDREMQSIAEAGFIVINLDARGTPGRTREFNEFGMGEGHNDCAADDHASAVLQLAARDKTIDAKRAAIGGWSGGGHCAYRLALRRGDVFKASAIVAPSTDPHILGIIYIEDFLGLYRDTPQLFDQGADDPNLNQLTSSLFFVHGELDEDVHPANTFRVIDQLIKHNKTFELLIVPGMGHSPSDDDEAKYIMNRIADFFSRSLTGTVLLSNAPD